MSGNSAAPAKVMDIATGSEKEVEVTAPFHVSARRQRVVIQGLIIECLIGIHAIEHEMSQRVSIDVELVRREPDDPTDESYARVMCYETVINQIRAIATEGHTKLVETLAERIAEACQLNYPDITALTIAVNKIDPFPHVASVGVQLERVFDPSPSPPRDTRNTSQ